MISPCVLFKPIENIEQIAFDKILIHVDSSD